MPNEAAGRYAVVTGSSSGIGLAVCRRLLSEGWRVSGVDRADPAVEHPAFFPLRLDLSDDEQCAQARERLERTPDALVHAAGILRTGGLGDMSAKDGLLMWKLHVHAAGLLANAIMPQMVERGSGRVVFLGSRVAGGLPLRGQYAASKAALVALARSWAAEVVSSGVTVNVVSPGATATAMLSVPERAASQPRLPPIGRLIEPDEVAGLVSYLLGPGAGAVTGQNIAICGGSSLSY